MQLTALSLHQAASEISDFTGVDSHVTIVRILEIFSDVRSNLGFLFWNFSVDRHAFGSDASQKLPPCLSNLLRPRQWRS